MKSKHYAYFLFFTSLFANKQTHAQNWLITGNSGLTNNNFIGTIDNKSLIFKTKNKENGRLQNDGIWKLGRNSGYITIDSSGNLNFNGVGVYQVADNRFVFESATHPNYGLVFGPPPLRSNALLPAYRFFDSTGNSSFEIGADAGNVFMKGDLHFSGNLFAVNRILSVLQDNVFLGSNAGINNTTGASNSFIGKNAGLNNTTGYSNTAIGIATLYYNTDKSNLVAIGDSALYNNGKGAISFRAKYNTAVGSKALFSNTEGTSNSAYGYIALFSNTTGNENTGIGTSALYYSTTGSNNTAIGFASLGNNSTGERNTGIGDHSLTANTTGSFNTAVGVYSGNYNRGDYNSFLGYVATSSDFLTNATAVGARAYVSASNSLVLGSIAGVNDATSSVNVGIGISAPTVALDVVGDAHFNTNNTTDCDLHLQTNNTNMGWYAKGISTQFNLYNYSTNTTLWNILGDGKFGIGLKPTHQLQLSSDDAAKPSTSTWTIASDARLKTNISDFKDGLEVIKKIHPVWFEYNGKANLPTGIKSVGVIAQEMQKIAPYMIDKYKYTDTLGKSEEFLDYNANALFYLLINSVKELSTSNDSKNETIDALRNANADQQKQIDELKSMMLQLQQNFNNCNLCAQNKTQQLTASTASLEQNIPNPFNHTTTINYALPQTYSSAKIIVADKFGKILKEINLSGNGKGSLQVTSSMLASGAYSYSLLLNGKLIDTKQMIMAK